MGSNPIGDAIFFNGGEIWKLFLPMTTESAVISQRHVCRKKWDCSLSCGLPCVTHHLLKGCLLNNPCCWQRKQQLLRSGTFAALTMEASVILRHNQSCHGQRRFNIGYLHVPVSLLLLRNAIVFAECTGRNSDFFLELSADLVFKIMCFWRRNTWIADKRLFFYRENLFSA